MTNDVAPVFGGNVAMPKAADLADALSDSGNKNPRAGAGDGTYLNFSGKTGRFHTGSGDDKSEYDVSTLLLPNISAFQNGWTCWKGGRPVETRLATIMKPPVPTPDMEEHGPFDKRNGEGWHQTKAMMLRDIDSEEQYYFKTNSVSGVDQIAKLEKAIADRARRGEAAWPVFNFKIEEFKAHGHTNFKPVIVVEGWLDDANVNVLFNDPEADLDELFVASETGASSDAQSLPSEGNDEPSSAEESSPSEDEEGGTKPPRRSRRRSL